MGDESESLQESLPQNISPIERVQLARHDRRPYALDLVPRIFADFTELKGDRRFRDDPAMIGGFAFLGGRPVMVIAHQKGRDMRERQTRNFGMPKPDGYRKALRLMQLAEKFRRPIFTFIDTPGAYPGIDAEERGQAEAIAVNLREMARIRTPILVTITGEGGSGGALAIGLGDEVNILENAVYSVITPEGCSAILWKDAGKTAEAAESLKITADDLVNLGVVDRVIPEPTGGAHTDWDGTAAILSRFLKEALDRVELMTADERAQARYEKFRKMGQFETRR